ncbi:MAG: CHAD domain-containing protein [Gammaproteobacteria bacterium]|jgi:CHAD domain-containing protein|nr:CHAD domain-containing protein [Gammaproteobacteria bacterium]
MAKKPKTPASIHASQTVSEAFVAIMRHNFAYLLEWQNVARSWEDIEGVHQLRVTVRRMRSALTLFRSAIPKKVSETWGDEMRWLAGELGMARDLDVFIAEGLTTMADKMPLDGAEKLLELAKAKRAHVYETQVASMLDSNRYRQFKDGFVDWFEHSRWESANLKGKQKKNLSMNLVAYSRNLMDKQERKVLSAGSNVDRDNPAEMHRLRIECKKLRYAAEFFSSMFTGMDVFIQHMKGLQDLLGLMNDVAVMKTLLNFVLEGSEDNELMVYSGGLIGWRTCDYYHMLDSFDEFWEEFIAAKHPWWKKSALVR